MEQDYRLTCRTCLAAEAEFYKLDALIAEDNDAEDNDKVQKTSFIECLRYCTRLPDVPEFPVYICTECSSALQVAYNFVRNALQAHEILCQKLCPSAQAHCYDSTPNRLTHTGKWSGVGDSSCSTAIQEKAMRFRCKVCGEKVESKKSLKEHVKLHLDIISYSCQMCAYETKKRSHLSEHYQRIHDRQASRELLKAKTVVPQKTSQKSMKEELEDLQTDEISLQMEALHNAPKVEIQQHDLEVGAVLSTDTNTINEFSSEFPIMPHELSREMSIGNEFIVMADGTVEEVMGNGVVIEYINAVDEDGVSLEQNDLVLNDVVSMDVDDLIIEENVATGFVEESSHVPDLPMSASIPLKHLPSITDARKDKKAICKICANNFNTQDQLKTHMLTHNEIPHFFCDRCPFYTFFKVDLMQHYKTLHNLEPTYKQLQPKNKVSSYGASSSSFSKVRSGAGRPIKTGGVGETVFKRYIYNCDLCLYETNAKVNLRRHYLSKHQQNATDVQLRPTTIEEIERSEEHCPNTDNVRNIDNLRNVNCRKPGYPNGLRCRRCNKTFHWPDKLKEHYRWHKLVDTNAKVDGIFPAGYVADGNTAFSDNTLTAPPTANAYAVPLDAMPQVVEIDDIIDDTEIDFDFNQDALFDDFDEENEDNEDLQDLLLTSDDDFEDLLEEQSENTESDTHPYCIHCNKKFLSQYQFENHMFVHRGLAPYRCEMCTNLYNTKRAIIRHYKAVHKRIPTRDMIQAKGDKVAVDKTPVEHLNLGEQKPTTLMCAKCPYESKELNNIEIHLKTSHGIQNEKFILQKLPFECPRCIRSYETKECLVRHLERSHSVATIIQQRQTAVDSSFTQNTAAAAATINAAPAASCGETIAELNQNSSPSNNNNDNTPTTLYTTAQSTAVAEIDLAVNTISDEAGLPQYQCVACEFYCQTLFDLDEHSKGHPRDGTRDTLNFMCPICKCKYKSLLLLKHHLKRHTGRTHACANCPKTFVNRRELEHHRLTHTGEMPYKCDACDKQFRYSHHLKRHTDVQHLGKRQLCTVTGCGRKFTTLAQLKIHSWNHNGNVPYRCKYCEREFKKRELLRQHAWKVHQVTLTEEEIAEIYRKTVGYTNPYDFTVPVSSGIMLRRSDAEEFEKLPLKGGETETL